MTEKTFLITMDEVCDLSFMNICQRYQKDCSGEICYRPSWCPLVEHSIGECHTQYKEAQFKMAEERDG